MAQTITFIGFLSGVCAGIAAMLNHCGSDVLRVLVLVDTPNLWCGSAIAGTPARLIALGSALAARGVGVWWVVCDRGTPLADLPSALGMGWLVHPSVFYGSPRRLADLVERCRPDVVVASDAEYVVTHGREMADRLGALLAYEAHDDESALSTALNEPRELSSRRGSWQAAAVASCDAVTALTPENADTMRSYGVSDDRLAVVPNGVDVAARTAWGPAVESRRLLFLGNLHYAPNAAAARWVATVPALHAGVCVRIVGRGPQTPASAAVEWVGAVPSGPAFDAIFDEVSLAVAPIGAGSGMKMKMLDYLAAGLPVLATSEAVQG
ncbi:MAG: glycosyltransferase family 4 protein, partial [Mycobacterium sp.]|nr:glycosyltransferase family 4 protein [Mycobacterium sp.]